MTENEYKTMYKSQKVHTCHTYLIPNNTIICFPWRYPELACKTKDICISKQENTTYIWYFDETKNFFVHVFSGDAFSGESMYAHVNSLILQSSKNFRPSELDTTIKRRNSKFCMVTCHEILHNNNFL
jgi:hypothetical protein